MKWLALCALLASSAAQAYVPPSQFIVKSMAAKHSGVKAVKVRSQVTAIENGQPSSELRFKTLTIVDYANRTIRGWAMDDADQKLYRVEKKFGASPVSALLFDANAQDLAAALVAQKIPVRTESDLLELPDEQARRASEVSSLRRWKGIPAWIIGRAEENQPQLWIEKDGFLPLRFVFKPERSASTQEVQFEGFKTYRGFPYPKTIFLSSSLENGVLREDMLELTTTPSAQELKAAVSGSGFTPAGEAIPTPLKDLIEKYFHLLR